MKTNISIDLLVMCELAQITQDGKLSLLGIFSRLISRSMPLRIPRFFMVAMLSGAPLAEYRVSFQILGPTSQDSIQEYLAKVSLGFDGRANVLNELTNTILMEYGEYTVIINIDGVKQASRTFVVSEPEERNLSRTTSGVVN